MGAAVSTSFSATTVVKDTLIKISSSTTQGCDMSSSLLQDLTFNDLEFRGCNVNFSNISQKLDVAQTLSCLQKSTNSADLKNAFKDKLKSEVDSTVSGIPNAIVSVSQAAQITQSINKITQNIDFSSVANCLIQTIMVQKQTYGKILFECSDNQTISFNNINQELLANLISKCVQENENLTKAINELDAEIQNIVSSANSGINIWGVVVLAIVVLICLVVGYYLYKTVMSGGGTSRSSVANEVVGGGVKETVKEAAKETAKEAAKEAVKAAT